MTDTVRPPPSRPSLDFVLLGSALAGIPAIWGLRLVVNYALDSYFCYPGDVRRTALPAGLGWVWPTLLGFDLLVLALTIALAVVSFLSMRARSAEPGMPATRMADLIRGRALFFLLWGLLIGIGFFWITAGDLAALWIVPECG